MAADRFGLDRTEPCRVDRSEATALVAVLKAGARDADHGLLSLESSGLNDATQHLASANRCNPGADHRLVLVQTVRRRHVAVWLREVTYMRLALKAQSQGRATLEAVVAVGHPPVLFAQQANVAFGPQQVNNCVPQASPSSPEKETEPNELSGGNP